MLEVIGEGDWTTAGASFAFFLIWAVTLNSTKEFERGWFESLLRICFWGGSIVAIFSKTVLTWFTMLCGFALFIAFVMIVSGGGGQWGGDGDSD